jgi:hypothetical protein
VNEDVAATGRPTGPHRPVRRSPAVTVLAIVFTVLGVAGGLLAAAIAHVLLYGLFDTTRQHAGLHRSEDVLGYVLYVAVAAVLLPSGAIVMAIGRRSRGWALVALSVAGVVAVVATVSALMAGR